MSRSWFRFLIVLFVVTFAVGVADAEPKHKGVLNAAFLCVKGVYNSELMAPYDILQHTVFRDDKNYVECFVVTPDGKPFVTFEGITITPHYSFADVPEVDIVIVPSTETSMSDDLENERYMAWLTSAVKDAKYVISACDGAFPLVKTGLLDGRQVTTFPSDREALAEMFPKVKVRDDVNFIADGKFITSVGGALSYEPALYLVELVYGLDNAKRVGKGLVLDWDKETIAHDVLDSAR